MGNAVFDPALAPVVEVEQRRHGAVEGIGKARLGRRPGVEFLPQGEQAFALRRRQQVAKAAHSGKFLGVAGLRVAFGIDEDVAGIDFAEIMHEQHLDHPVHVAARRRVGRECLGEEGDLPAVLGGVLVAVEPERTVLARHAFELVEFENEGDGVVHGGDSGLKRLRRDAAQDFAFGGIVLVSARQGARFRPARRLFAFARWRRAFSGRLWGEGVR